jgi:hypothetical protein
MQETIDDYARNAWDEYTPPKELEEGLDSLTDQQYFLCGDMFAEGFRAGFAFRLTHHTGE